MLCCSLIAVVLGQCGVLAGLGRWIAARWIVLGAGFVIEAVLAAVALLRLYAIGEPSSWPLCIAGLRTIGRVIAH